MSKERIKRILNDFSGEFERKLEEYIPEGEPRLLREAMRHAILGSGKRVRPALLICCDHLLRYPEKEQLSPDWKSIPEAAWLAGAALEMIHTYSLIHDDLPCMDDDALRRGKPTVHMEYGAATAVLAGDALLTDSFSLLGRIGIESDTGAAGPEIAGRITALFANEAGSRGMIAGQFTDIQSEGRESSLETLEYIHRNKTMKLIRLPLITAGLLCGLNEEKLTFLKGYGTKIGMLFQITDDILNVTGSEEELGKPAGTDEEREKATYPALFGIERSRKIAEEYRDEAIALLEKISIRESLLSLLPDYLISRKK